jgi:hypothetical protein
MKRLAALALLSCAGTLPVFAASQPNLSTLIPPGQWEFRYERHALVDALGLDKSIQGSRRVCLGNDPRKAALNFLKARQCTVASDRFKDKQWQLTGSCRFKWQKKPVPFKIDFNLNDGRNFSIDISTPQDKLVAYRENSLATRISPTCPKKL